MSKKKSLITLVSLLVILCVTVGGTVAYLVTATSPITNTFDVLKVTTAVQENTSGGTKTDVKIKNTGTTDAYIRAAVVVTWQDADGNIHALKPVPGEDYTIRTTSNNWDRSTTDGFFYYTVSVPANGTTDNLIDSIAPVANQAPDGYYLAVEIIASGIQAKTGTAPAVSAWSVTANGNTISK